MQSEQQKSSRRGFDYDKIGNGKKRGELEEHARIINGRIKTMSKYALDIGRRLDHAQSVAGRGHFREWLAEETGMSRSSAYHYISIARMFGHYEEFFQLGALDVLGAQRAPRQAQRDAVEIAKRGQIVTELMAQRLVDEHRQAHNISEEDVLNHAIADVVRIVKTAGTLNPNGRLKVAKALVDAGRDLGPIRIHSPSRDSSSAPTEEET